MKIKADNTYNYKLPPSIIEVFWKSILNSNDALKQLTMLYESGVANPKSSYNILDYVNTIDGIVRRVELELGIQDREMKVTPVPDVCTCSPKNITDCDSMFTSMLAQKQEVKVKVDSGIQTEERDPVKILKEIEKNIESVGYDSDDVFANNPSTLMMAKVKVPKKAKPVVPELPKIIPKPEPKLKDNTCP